MTEDKTSVRIRVIHAAAVAQAGMRLNDEILRALDSTNDLALSEAEWEALLPKAMGDIAKASIKYQKAVHEATKKAKKDLGRE